MWSNIDNDQTIFLSNRYESKHDRDKDGWACER
ncbi:excalibur calcium-binding domain-containing protein [Bacillus kandeliae]